MEKEETGGRPVKTVETAFEIVETLRDMDGAGLTELESELGLARSTVHRHLTTLLKHEYVVKEDKKYYPSLQFLDLGQYTRSRKKAYSLAEEKVHELAAQTDERAQFMIEEHGYAVYVYMATGGHAVEVNTHVGKHVPLNASAAGLAILAKVDESEVREIIERRGLPKLAKNTITDRETLFNELEAIRDRGYSINDQGFVNGLRAIGTPVKDRDGAVIGALSLSGPTNRMQDERFENELPNLLLGAANELELNIAYP